MEKLFAPFVTPKIILNDSMSHSMRAIFRLGVLALLPTLFSACGGEGNGNQTTPSPASSFITMTSSSSSVYSSLATSSSSIASGADTSPPILSDAKAVVSTDEIILSIVANDNVELSSVTFMIDDEALKTVEQKNPSGGTYSSSFPIWIREAGTHHFVAIATDAAGNSTSTESVSFIIEDNLDANQGNAAPTVSDLEVDGNFGVLTLKAIAKDDVKLFDVEFLIDGKPTGWAERLNTREGAPANQYYVIVEALLLTFGPHRLVVKARDYDGNITASDEIIFNVDATAGLTEIEPNNDMASANIVANNQLKMAGTLKNFKENLRIKLDYDYYRVTIPAEKTLTVNMLALPSTISLSIHDSNGNIISGEPVRNPSEVEVSYTNGPISKVVYIAVSAGFVIYGRDQYRLSLNFH